jgi:hypothetical protein
MRSLCLVLTFLVVVAPLANAKSKNVERVCTGELTDMRVIGVTLGDCDLNSITDDDFAYVEDVCGYST